MSEVKDKVFADGFIFKKNENAPSFVVGGMSIKVEEAIAFLKKQEKKGWVNLNIKQSQGGKYYCELDTWEKKENTQATAPSSKEETTDDLPF